MPHAWHFFESFLPESRAAFEESANFLSAHVVAGRSMAPIPSLPAFVLRGQSLSGRSLVVYARVVSWRGFSPRAAATGYQQYPEGPGVSN